MATYHKKQILPSEGRVAAAKRKKEELASGDTTKFLAHSLKMWDLDKLDFNYPDLVESRVRWYFELCVEDDTKPSMEGLAMALGISRNRLINFASDRKISANKESMEIVGRSIQMLNAMMTDFMMNNKVQPLTGIFLMKNNFGYSDKTDVQVAPKNLLGEGKTNEELQKKYLSNLEVIDADFKPTSEENKSTEAIEVEVKEKTSTS